MMDELPILLYTTPEGAVKVKAVLKDETMWLTQAGMADLFDVAPQNMSDKRNSFFRGVSVSCGIISLSYVKRGMRWKLRKLRTAKR